MVAEGIDLAGHVVENNCYLNIYQNICVSLKQIR